MLPARASPPLRRFALVCCLAAVSGGCSSFQLLYNIAGDLIEREAASFLDLDEDEAAHLEQRVAELVDWNRRQMLPRYATFMTRNAARLERGDVTAPGVALTMQEVRRLFDATVEGASPFVATVLVRHTSGRKLDHLRVRLAARAEEFAEQLRQPPSRRAEERRERIVGHFERFVGDLSEQQHEIVRTYVEDTGSNGEIWLAHRRLRNEAFLAFLSAQPTEAGIAAFFERLVLRPYEVAGPDYKRVSVAWWQRFEAFLLEMLSSLTPEQRRQAGQTLRAYARDMIELSS